MMIVVVVVVTSEVTFYVEINVDFPGTITSVGRHRGPGEGPE